MPIPSNGQNFVRPQSGGSGGWISKLFGGVGDAARAKQMAQIQFDLHQAKAGVDTEHRIKRAVGEESAKAFGTIETAKGVSKIGLKTFGKYTAPKEEYTDAKGRKRTRGGMGLNVKDIAGFDQNYMPRFQATGLNRTKTDGQAPVDSGATDGGKQTTGGAGKAPRKTRAKKTSGSQPKGSTGSPDTPDASSGAPAVTPAKTRKPRTPKAGA